MAEKTLIAWTDRTFNAWIGCQKISPGCAHCYAETMVTGRMGRPNLWGPGSERSKTSIPYWKEPLKWNREAQASGEIQRVFCGSLMDVFEPHPGANIIRPQLWKLIHQTPFLHWQMLTKRPENIIPNLPD